MRTLIVNGSPKGYSSVTLKTAQYLEKLYPEHEFEYLHAGAGIHGLEKNFDMARRQIEQAELIIFAYPVYTFLAPAQVHRFLELMQENGVSLAGKHATQISTSKHFFDTTAHAFIELNLQDLGADVYAGLSADMEDLLSANGRMAARSFFDTLQFQIARGMSRPREDAVPERQCTYSASLDSVPKSNRYTVALITCLSPNDTGLAEMIRDFEAIFPYQVRRIDLYDFPFRGGCLGCLQCAADGTCVYTDGFQEMLRSEIDACDGQVFAFPIRNHFTYSQMKTFNDRQFCNGHRTVSAGTPAAYILSGDYSAEHNLRTVIEARAAVGQNFLAGVATDEHDTARQIEDLAASMAYALENKAVPAQNFYGAGGSRIFRDLVFKMQGIMHADHQFFKEHGLYDSFPQHDRKTMRRMKLAGSLLRMPRIGAYARQNLDKYMIAPYEKVLDGAVSDNAETKQ